MRTSVAVTLIALSFVALAVRAEDGEAVAKSEAAATAWLALTDAGKYAQSWDEAASRFKTAVGKADWEKALRAVRAPLGALRSRRVESATFTRRIPGAPEGEYVVIVYATQFANKPDSTETVTPMHDKDGAWRVSGYYIK